MTRKPKAASFTGEDSPHAILTMQDVVDIRTGFYPSDKEAAAVLGVSKVAVWFARVGRTWKTCPIPPHAGRRPYLSLDRSRYDQMA